jgi:hypothetical protein
VLSVDEKSPFQALNRTQPGQPMKKGRVGMVTHDHISHGTTTLFAALNVPDGTVIGKCMARHRHQEFTGFFNRIEGEIPAGKSSMSSSTITAAASTPRCVPGSIATSSTSRRAYRELN